MSRFKKRLSKLLGKPAIKYLLSHKRGQHDIFREYSEGFLKQSRANYISQYGDYTKIIDMLDDEQSKVNYERETSLKIFPNYTDHAALLSPVTPLAWERAVEKTRKLIDANKVHKYHCYQEESLLRLLTPTIIFNQYEYFPHVQVENNDIFFDCGGYVGDTAIWAQERGAKHVYSFEPSAENQKFFEKNIKEFGGENITLIPFGVGKEKTTLHFYSDPQNPSASSVRHSPKSSAHIISIPVYDIDSWCAHNNVAPTFIKMDIEGAEMDALRGARNTIINHKPKLAICLYHRVSDMIEIPTIIKEWCPEYRLWCKKSAIGSEFVLFAAA